MNWGTSSAGRVLGQESARRYASVPPSRKMTEPTRKLAAGDSMKIAHCAISSGFPNSRTGMGKALIAGASSGSLSCCSSSGVRIAPGASALTRMPCPAHSSVTPTVRIQWVIAVFDPA